MLKLGRRWQIILPLTLQNKKRFLGVWQRFLGMVFAFRLIRLYIGIYQLTNVWIMSKWSVDISTEDDCRKELLYVIQAMLRVPSMWDKLPKYMLVRLEGIEAYIEKHGVEWLLKR